MKLGDLKPKGSDMTLAEWAEMCDKADVTCRKCDFFKECNAAFDMQPMYYGEWWILELEVEV